ncbi:glycoside hydrolase domain-containing protein [Nocardioides sp.]|uniref:glycoside hydrolase domain-containing protein n=1 Tax=Nocardioides sp. TaxID=35761 RepID=UPI002B27902C|nr:glycoside hydrolase domain-containing protein [Nocardioides sp.]
MSPSSPRTLLRTGVTALSLSALVAVGLPASAPATAAPASPATTVSTVSATGVVLAKKEPAPNPVTPGDFTGYGFDQCVTPTQSMMNTWLKTSPYLAVGIYISGDSRACRDQPNLNPTWVRKQLRKGWRLLPIILGPQASCQPRFPRYADDFTINPSPGKRGIYGKARGMGKREAVSTLADARALGLVEGSTLWYDLEGFDDSNTHCRESALSFLTAWNRKISAAGYVTGVYSSAGSGIKVLDEVRRERPNAYTLPERIWLARWDGQANTSTSYIAEDGWRPGGRIKQYRGGHDEVWGGVRINIDSNYLDMGAGSTAPREDLCPGVTVASRDYPALRQSGNGYKPPKRMVKALQCFLSERNLYSGSFHGKYGPSTVKAANAWQARTGNAADATWIRRDWMTLLSYGRKPVLKFGSAGFYVRRLQRTLNAADLGSSVKIDGVYKMPTADLVKTYQSRVDLPTTGVVDGATWRRLMKGVRA